MTNQTYSVERLTRMLQLNESVIAIHYACESFLTAKDHPPGVASIAIYDVATREVTAFSRTEAPKGIAPADLELDLLRRFFARLSSLQESLVVYWNMNRPEYGFEALVARLRYLTDDQVLTPVPARRIDLDDLFLEQFGVDYAPHGRLQSMANLNELDVRSFLSGKDEAARFTEKDWSALSRSCASKAKIIGDLLLKLVNGTARTASSAGVVGFAGSRLEAVKVVTEIADRFILVRRSLRKHPRGGQTIVFNDEWDDQYLFKGLLRVFFEDVRDEEYIPSYAGSNSRIDYLLPEYAIGIELKHASGSLREKEVGEQLIIDRDRYKQLRKIGHLICIVFDPDGWVANPRGIENDLQVAVSEPGLTVTVFIVDR